MRGSEQEESQLSALAEKKQNVDSVCDSTASFEDDGEDAYWAQIDGIELALEKTKSKKKVWVVDYDGYQAIFVEDSYQDVENKLNGLPNR